MDSPRAKSNNFFFTEQRKKSNKFKINSFKDSI